MPVETETLSLQLLGGFRISAGDAAVRIDQPRLQRLLAYLLLHRRHPRPRQQIAFTLWPDTNEEQALKNLRTLLTRLRQTQPELERFLEMGAYALHWRPDAPCSLDVAGFEAACAEAVAAAQHGETAAAIAAYTHAVQLYTGDLTPGWYDEWIVPERERLRQLHLDALEQLARLLDQAGRLRDALGYAQQLQRADPLHEAAYRQLMQLHLSLDDRASALRVYHTGATTLRNELGVDPSPATQALYLRILTLDDEPAAQTQPAAALPAANPTPGAAALVDRQAEWATLKQVWQSAAAGRAQLVLISGEAGIGKTRLAEELLTWVERQGAATAVARCYASGGSLAYAPVAEWLRSPGLQVNVRQLDGIWRSETARLLPEMLADRPDLPPPGPMTEAWQRQRFFQALGRAVLGADAGKVDAGHTAEAAGLAPPRLLLLDDGQWCDRDTLDWLHFLIQANANVPLLVLATVRVEEVGEDHPLTALRLALARHDLVQDLHLAPLNAVATSALAADLLGHSLAPAEAARLFRDTEGNPLFVMETVRAGMAEGEPRRAAEGMSPAGEPGAVTTAALPPKVRAVIRRRLAMLSPGAQAADGTRPYGITVLAVHPGTVRTPMSEYARTSPHVAELAKPVQAWFEHLFAAQLDTPIEQAVAFMLALAEGCADALSGCYLDVDADLAALTAQAAAIQAEKRYTLRLQA
jgi:DNA-binding SARP family transcriptional activator